MSSSYWKVRWMEIFPSSHHASCYPRSVQGGHWWRGVTWPWAPMLHYKGVSTLSVSKLNTGKQRDAKGGLFWQLSNIQQLSVSRSKRFQWSCKSAGLCPRSSGKWPAPTCLLPAVPRQRGSTRGDRGNHRELHANQRFAGRPHSRHPQLPPAPDPGHCTTSTIWCSHFTHPSPNTKFLSI